MRILITRCPLVSRYSLFYYLPPNCPEGFSKLSCPVVARYRDFVIGDLLDKCSGPLFSRSARPHDDRAAGSACERGAAPVDDVVTVPTCTRLRHAPRSHRTLPSSDVRYRVTLARHHRHPQHHDITCIREEGEEAGLVPALQSQAAAQRRIK